MSIKTGQAILKCFIDLKSSVWFALGSEDETVFCDTFFQVHWTADNVLLMRFNGTCCEKLLEAAFSHQPHMRGGSRSH